MKVVKTAIVVGLTLVLSGISFAQSLPFEWPASYRIEYIQQAPGDPVTVVYSVSGNKARNEVTKLKINAGPSITNMYSYGFLGRQANRLK